MKHPFYWLGIFLATASDPLNISSISQFGSYFATVAGQEHDHGRNLVVAGAPLPVSLEIKRNATGHIVDLSGVSALMLDWLTRRYKLNYTILQVNDSVLEPGGAIQSHPGLISYVVNGQCDVIMAAIRLSPDRFRHLDFIHPWMYARSAFLIPMPGESKNNILAVVKPFHYWVWIALIGSLVSVIATLFYFSRIHLPLSDDAVTVETEGGSQPVAGLVSMKQVVAYVLGTLLSQGGSFTSGSNPFKIRLVTGAWCLVTLVLVNVYNGILISYVTSNPRERPLVDSPDDLLANRNIHLVVEKGQGADFIFSTAESGMFKALGDKLRAYPKSRCLATEQCIDLVKSQPYQHVYFNTRVVLLAVLRQDFRKTGQCNLVQAAERYSDNTAFCWGLTKNSPYTEKFNRGVMSMREVGLVGLWERWHEPDVRPCDLQNHHSSQTNKKKKKKKQKKPLVRLTLTNLNGAFVLLGLGYVISFLVFLKERIRFRIIRII
ncbi:uncharacterized protein LOC124200588 [Daphnia pulex]|uniref:uncharacterized protein LOC124200588 n=1 Tax=Daphnia pulex TaxID=6669 RepID=UPI001EDD9B11|nr:uncharacterized protein LOC124200588 [Daphnia pulex]